MLRCVRKQYLYCMHVLLISVDTTLCDTTSASFARHVALSQKVSQLTIFVFSSKKFSITEGNMTIRTVPFHPFSIAVFLRYCNTYHVSLLSAQDPLRCGLFAYILSKLTHIPFEVQLHGDWFGNYYRNRSRLWNFVIAGAAYITRRAHSVRAVSLRVMQSLEKISVDSNRVYIAPIMVAYDTTQTDLSELLPEISGKQIILCVARLYPEKNVALLMQALPYIRSYVPNAHVVVVGDGGEIFECKAIAKSLGCIRMVSFVGNVAHTYSYYTHADVVVIPSLTESFSRVVLEATHVGVPVVMTDVGLAGDVIIDKESGRVIAAFDDGLLAEAIVDVLLHPHDAVAYVTTARSIIQSRFDTDPQEISVHYWKKLIS